MIAKKPAPDLIRGGNRFSEKIMRQRNQEDRHIKRSTAACACKTAEKPGQTYCAASQYLLRAQPRALPGGA
jgi:hypothetical protein